MVNDIFKIVILTSGNVRLSSFTKSLCNLDFSDYDDAKSLQRLLQDKYPTCDVRIYRSDVPLTHFSGSNQVT